MTETPIQGAVKAARKAGKGENAARLRLSEFTPYRFVALGRSMSERLGRAYAGENLTIPEWRVLAVISEAASMAARDVVAKTPMDKMAVSRAVASLEDKGLVVRRAAPDDRRVYVLVLSPGGRRVYERVATLAIEFEETLLSALEPAERRQLALTLAKLEEYIGRRFELETEIESAGK